MRTINIRRDDLTGTENGAADKTAVLLLGGEPAVSVELLKIVRQAAFVAAADAGAAMALSAGRLPDLLVGDFDSLAAPLLSECQAGGVPVHRLPVCKDMTDGEYLLSQVKDISYRRLLILGGLGGRLDHMLANIGVTLPLAADGWEIVFATDDMLAVVLAAEDEPCELVLSGFKGRTFSLQSLSAECRWVQETGFQYPLDGVLRQDSSLGVSNVVVAETAYVRLSGGKLLACLEFLPENRDCKSRD